MIYASFANLNDCNGSDSLQVIVDVGKNSSMMKTEKSMLKLTAWFFLNSIPKIQSLAHAYYFLHSEVSFIQNTKMLSPRKTKKKIERKTDIRTNKNILTKQLTCHNLSLMESKPYFFIRTKINERTQNEWRKTKVYIVGQTMEGGKISKWRQPMTVL